MLLVSEFMLGTLLPRLLKEVSEENLTTGENIIDAVPVRVMLSSRTGLLEPRMSLELWVLILTSCN